MFMKRHIMKHHKTREQVYKCTECEDSFTVEQNFIRHVQTNQSRTVIFVTNSKYVHQVDNKKINLARLSDN